MTREEAKKRLEVRLICANCPEDKMCYDSHLHSICEYTDYCDEVPIEEAVKVAIEVLGQAPCEDAISRKAAIDAMEYCDFTKSENDELALYEEDVIEALKSLPPVNPQEPKTGHWIDSNSYLMVVMGDTVMNLPAKECSICHKPHIRGYGADFCPNCGAKMQEVVSDDKV